MNWDSRALLLISLVLAGCSYPISEKDSTTLLFLLETPLNGDEMDQEIKVIESRLRYLGFEVEGIAVAKKFGSLPAKVVSVMEL